LVGAVLVLAVPNPRPVPGAPPPPGGRPTTLLESGRLLRDLRLPPLDPAVDRLMVCGSPALLSDVCVLLDARGFTPSPHTGEPGDYLIERAFVTRAPS